MNAMKNNAAKPRPIGRPRSFDRDAVLEQAMLTFWRHGYETTSISDLTRAMNVTAPSIYSAFGDKKQLFLEAMYRYAGSLDDLERSLYEAETAREAAQGMLVAAAAAFTDEATPPGCLLASATASGSKDSADVQAAVTEVRRAIMERLRARIEHDIAAGRLPRHTQAAPLATWVITLIQGMSVLARDGMANDALQAMIDAAMNAWPLSD